jgi:hypothetical protein
VPTTKVCRICGATKPIDDFYRDSGMRDGYRSECKSCLGDLRRKRYDRDREVRRSQEWRKQNPERFRAYQTAYRARPERKRATRDQYYRRTFGISADEFDDLLAAQGGGCAICGVTPTRAASLHLDHCHGSGELRGILCLSCNQGLGNFADDPARLERAAAYLRGARATSGAG